MVAINCHHHRCCCSCCLQHLIEKSREGWAAVKASGLSAAPEPCQLNDALQVGTPNTHQEEVGEVEGPQRTQVCSMSISGMEFGT